MIEITEKIKGQLLLVAIVIIVILLVSRGCGNVEIGSGTGDVIKSDTTTTKETIIHTHSIDTVVKWKPYYVKNIPLDSQRVNLSDSVHINDTFYYGINDTLLNGSIMVSSKIRPDSVSFDYNIAEQIIKDSVYIRDSVYTKIVDKVRVNQIYVGGEVVVYPKFNAIFLTVDFVSKKGWQLEGGVGVIDESPGIKVGFKKLITFRKK